MPLDLAIESLPRDLKLIIIDFNLNNFIMILIIDSTFDYS